MRNIAVVGGLLAVTVVAAGVFVLLDGRPVEDPPQGSAPTVVVDMTTFRYAFDPGSNESLNVARGSLVVIRITSLDVTHGFAIPEYNVNVEVPPGETVEVRFRASKPGEFTMFCTVFCGAGHPEHKGTLHVA